MKPKDIPFQSAQLHLRYGNNPSPPRTTKIRQKDSQSKKYIPSFEMFSTVTTAEGFAEMDVDSECNEINNRFESGTQILRR